MWRSPLPACPGRCGLQWRPRGCSWAGSTGGCCKERGHAQGRGAPGWTPPGGAAVEVWWGCPGCGCPWAASPRALWAGWVCHAGVQDGGCSWSNFLHWGTAAALAGLWRGVWQRRDFSAPLPPGPARGSPGGCRAEPRRRGVQPLSSHCSQPHQCAPFTLWPGRELVVRLSRSWGDAGSGGLQGRSLGRSGTWSTGQHRDGAGPGGLSSAEGSAGSARAGEGRPILGPVSRAALLGCTGLLPPPADTAPFPPLCPLFSSHSLSLFAFPFTARVPTSVGTLGEAGKHQPMARFVLLRVGT